MNFTGDGDTEAGSDATASTILAPPAPHAAPLAVCGAVAPTAVATARSRPESPSATTTTMNKTRVASPVASRVTPLTMELTMERMKREWPVELRRDLVAFAEESGLLRMPNTNSRLSRKNAGCAAARGGSGEHMQNGDAPHDLCAAPSRLPASPVDCSGVKHAVWTASIVSAAVDDDEIFGEKGNDESAVHRKLTNLIKQWDKTQSLPDSLRARTEKVL